MSDKDITVIVPVYNVEQYIARCLDSLLNQTYKNYQVLCVDDHGQDKSMDIVLDYQNKYPNIIKVIANDKNRGLGYTRDHGLQETHTKYVMFVDSDDYVKEDHLETYLNEMEKTNADIVIGGYIRDIEGKMVTYKSYKDDPYFPWIYFTVCSKMFRTEYLKKNDINFKGYTYCEDVYFTYSLLRPNPKLSIIDYEGYYYFYNPKSITQNRTIDRSYLFETNIKEMRDYLSKNPLHDNQEIIQYTMASVLTINLMLNGRSRKPKRMMELYRLYDEYLKDMGIDLKKNKFISLSIPKSEMPKYRWATWLTLRLRRIGLDKALFWLISFI